MPPTRRGLRTRRHLIERCAHVFDRNGYAAATLEEMVQATGFTRGAFYFHFDSKDALAQAVVDDQSDRWSLLLEQVRAAEPDPLRALVCFSFASAGLHQSDTVVRAASRLISERAMADRNPPETYRWWVSTVRDLLSEAMAAGSLRGDAVGTAGSHRNLDELATYLVSSWTGNHIQTVAGLIDLPDQLYTGWRLTLETTCHAPEPLTGLLELAGRLREHLRADPAGLVAGFGRARGEDDPH
jgi:AcrR family transcriptional regulator